MENWYGFVGYYDGFSWLDWDDFCKFVYYNFNCFVQCNVIVFNIGLLVKLVDVCNCMVYVIDFCIVKLLSSVNFEFYDFQQQFIGFGIIDGDGCFQVDLFCEFFVVVVKQGLECGYFRLQDGDVLLFSKFDVEGVVV